MALTLLQQSEDDPGVTFDPGEVAAAMAQALQPLHDEILAALRADQNSAHVNRVLVARSYLSFSLADALKLMADERAEPVAPNLREIGA